ncbi:MAG: DNA polymerase I [bacterium]
MSIPISKYPVLFIVDGSSYIFRAYHALPPLTNKKGIPTNAVYGYTNMLIKTIEKYKPEYFVVVFDSKGPTFREKVDITYKANRGVPPDDLAVQFPYVFEITEALRIKYVFVEGFEADDVIATITDKAKKAGFGVVIIGTDKDLMSLIDDDVVMLDTMKDQWITRQTVVEKFGVEPYQMRDFLMLTGDSIDNIKGVQGVGKKTAMELLKKYGSVDMIYKNINEITNQRIKASLMDAKENLYNVTKQLVQLRRDVPVDVDLESFNIKGHPPSLEQREKLIKLFSELEFNRLIEKLGTSVSQKQMLEYTQIKDIMDIKDALERAEELSLFLWKDIVCIYTDHAYYLKCHDPAEALRFLVSLQKEITVHDAKAIYKLCLNHNIQVNARLFSVELAAYLCNPEAKSYTLESLSLSELGEQLPSLLSMPSVKEASDGFGGLFAQHKNSKNEDNSVDRYEPVDLIRYAVQLKRLSEVYKKRLKQDGLEPLFYKVEMPLSAVLAEMEYTGIRVDSAYLKELSRQFAEQLDQLRSRMQAFVPESFNPDSPKQIANILFEKLKLQPIKKTKTGYSTDNEVLIELKGKHPFVDYLVNYRNLAKLKNSFVDTLPSFVSKTTGRIHTHFLQTGTATGRLASSEPNLQNIPVKDDYGRMIRKAFIADEGYSILSADYSQIELRIMAHLSSDEALIDAFLHDQDIHATTASRIFNVPVAEVTPQMRSNAKVVNFGILYGMSAYGLSKQLNIPQEQAQIIIDAYFNQYKGVKSYIDDVLNGVRQTGYVGTILGRRRYIPKTLDNPAYQRIAINTPVQGSAADLIKLAMLKMNDAIKRERYDARMLLQIHDELVFEVKDEQVQAFSSVVKTQMEGAMKLLVPLKVSISTGKTWADTKV